MTDVCTAHDQLSYKNNMRNSELQERMQELGLSYADIGRGLKEVGVKGTTEGVRAIARRTIKEPSKAKKDILEQVIAILGGQLHVTWIDQKLYKKYTQFRTK